MDFNKSRKPLTNLCVVGCTSNLIKVCNMIKKINTGLRRVEF